MERRNFPLLVAVIGLVGALILCGSEPDDTAQAIQGAALLLTSVLIWIGWYIGHRLMLGVAGLSEIVRLLEASRRDKPGESE